MAISPGEIERVTKAWVPVSGFVRVPRSELEYNELVGLLDQLSDEVGEDENHPLASLMDVIGVLFEKYEDEHVERGLYKRGLPDELKMSREGEPSRFEHFARAMEAWPVMWHSHPEKRKEVVSPWFLMLLITSEGSLSCVTSRCYLHWRFCCRSAGFIFTP